MSFKLEKQYRLPGYDYSRPGFYFITICTKDREEFFGEIINNEMVLSKIGEIVQFYWLELVESFENINLDEFIIMPNHVHMVIEIMEYNYCRNAPWRVLAESNITIRPLQKNSISSIINHFKGNVKRYCNKNESNFFCWQSKFYDRIIHDEKALFKIRNYIKTNPEKWFRDRNNKEDIFM